MVNGFLSGSNHQGQEGLTITGRSHFDHNVVIGSDTPINVGGEAIDGAAVIEPFRSNPIVKLICHEPIYPQLMIHHPIHGMSDQSIYSSGFHTGIGLIGL